MCIVCVRTSEDVPYDAQQAAVECEEVEEDLDGGADDPGRPVGGGEGLLDDLGERDEYVAWRVAGVEHGLVAGVDEGVASEGPTQEQE